MSGEIEAAGALATAGLAAGAIEGREGHGAGDGACLNCGAVLAGAYCSQCGQAAHAHRTLSHLFEEVLHGLIHFDTKAWRTLPMLVGRPGTLTRNYIYGKRARYISPLALFLFTIFLMFFVFAFVDVNVLNVNATETPADMAQELDEARADLAEAEQELVEARAAPQDPYTPGLAVQLAEQEVALARAEVERREAALARANARTAASANETSGAGNEPSEQAASAPAESGAAAPAPEGEIIGIGASDEATAEVVEGERTWQDAVREAARNGDITVNTGFPRLDARILHSFENPDLALYKIQQAAYKFSFLLVPISLPFMWLLFIWRRGLTLYDHVVFTLYSLSFASLLFIVLALVNDVPWLEWVGASLLFLGMPVHMYFHLKGAYALGWFSALWRSLFLMLFAFLALTIFFIAIILLGLGG
jgi:hypothetical protein